MNDFSSVWKQVSCFIYIRIFKDTFRLLYSTSPSLPPYQEELLDERWTGFYLGSEFLSLDQSNTVYDINHMRITAFHYIAKLAEN